MMQPGKTERQKMTNLFTKAAEEFAAQMDIKTRADGSEYYVLNKSNPEFCKVILEAVCPGYSFPDDIRYEMAARILDHAAEYEDADDAMDGLGHLVPIYTADQLAWVSSNDSRTAYCDEAINGGLTDDFSSAIVHGYILELEEIAAPLFAAITEYAEQMED
jgi:hypothetical protein